MKPARKGTKANPFKVGDRVVVRSTGPVGGTVLEVKTVAFGDEWNGGRAFNPIRYRIVMDATKIEVWLEPRDLEAEP